jgi:hypothetical protein
MDNTKTDPKIVARMQEFYDIVSKLSFEGARQLLIVSYKHTPKPEWDRARCVKAAMHEEFPMKLVDEFYANM